MCYRLLLAVFAGMSMALPVAAAESPVAIVMAVTGDTEPSLPALTEILADTPVRLAPRTALTFLHYARCKMVTVTGGVLSMNRIAYQTDGRIDSEVDGPCPVVSEIAGPARGTTTGGSVFRGIHAAPRWPVNLDIVLAGPSADKVRAAAIYAEDRPNEPLLRLDLEGRRISEPRDAPSLPPNHHYRLRLVVSDRPEPLDLPFFGRAATGAKSLLVLRID